MQLPSRLAVWSLVILALHLVPLIAAGGGSPPLSDKKNKETVPSSFSMNKSLSSPEIRRKQSPSSSPGRVKNDNIIINGPVTICTHDNVFHSDEALATFMLKQLPEYEDAEVIRTRDKIRIDACTIAIDVGGVYDPQRLRFDHHQRGFGETLDGHTTKLSTAGMVYKHFGKALIAQATKSNPEDATVDLVYKQLYVEFVEALDAHDNGISAYESNDPPKFLDRTKLPDRVSILNPPWNGPQNFDDKFKDAVALTGTDFMNRFHFLVNVWLPCREIVKAGIQDRDRYVPESHGRVIKLSQFCPFNEHIFDLEKEMGLRAKEKQVAFVVFKRGLNWNVQAVPEAVGSFRSRVTLPKAWYGLEGSSLDAVTGLEPGAVFAHATGFIGGHETEKGAQGMALKALQGYMASD